MPDSTPSLKPYEVRPPTPEQLRWAGLAFHAAFELAVSDSNYMQMRRARAVSR